MVSGGSSPVVFIATAASFGSWHFLPGDLLFSPFFLLYGVHFCDWVLMWGAGLVPVSVNVLWGPGLENGVSSPGLCAQEPQAVAHAG